MKRCRSYFANPYGSRGLRLNQVKYLRVCRWTPPPGILSLFKDVCKSGPPQCDPHPSYLSIMWEKVYAELLLSISATGDYKPVSPTLRSRGEGSVMATPRKSEKRRVRPKVDAKNKKSAKRRALKTTLPRAQSTASTDLLAEQPERITTFTGLQSQAERLLRVTKQDVVAMLVPEAQQLAHDTCKSLQLDSLWLSGSVQSRKADLSM